MIDLDRYKEWLYSEMKIAKCADASTFPYLKGRAEALEDAIKYLEIVDLLTFRDLEINEYFVFVKPDPVVKKDENLDSSEFGHGREIYIKLSNHAMLDLSLNPGSTRQVLKKELDLPVKRVVATFKIEGEDE